MVSVLEILNNLIEIEGIYTEEELSDLKNSLNELIKNGYTCMTMANLAQSKGIDSGKFYDMGKYLSNE